LGEKVRKEDPYQWKEDKEKENEQKKYSVLLVYDDKNPRTSLSNG
jgi:hypothetical protein